MYVCVCNVLINSITISLLQHLTNTDFFLSHFIYHQRTTTVHTEDGMPHCTVSNSSSIIVRKQYI